MPVRRAADPLNVQYVWDAIKSAAHQKQVSDLARIAKYIQKFCSCTQAQSELYVKQTLQDGLIVEVKRISQKGSTLGSEVESYKINKQEDLQTPEDDGHDWYCIECHLAGDVTPCRQCYRVFHAECSTNARQKQTLFPKRNHSVPSASDPKTPEAPAPKSGDGVEQNAESNDDHIYDETVCSLCNLTELDTGCGLDAEEFNYLLNFILHRIRSWVPDVLTSRLSESPFEWHTFTELSWRAGQLFYQHMDMAAVELKIRTKEYLKFSEFHGDIVTMLHNIAIFHGVESQEYGAAELMIADMKHDISELQNCVDCYRHSNEKINNKWFCLPCRTPHQLVWAKQKGYPYWPAKVIRETDSSCDVRFFGGKYERSVLPKNCIKPITVNMSQLQVKRTATFNKAVEELHFHQKLLENPNEVAKLQNLVEKRGKRSPVIKLKKSTPVNVQNSEPERRSRNSRSRRNTESEEEVQNVSLEQSKEEPGRRRNLLETDEATSPKTRRTSITIKRSSNRESQDVINISDAEEDRDKSFQFFPNNSEFNDSEQEQVTSSTELDREDNYVTRESDGVMQQLDQPYSDAVERMRRKLETCKDKKELINIAMDCMQQETDRLTNDHNETLRRLFESHNAQISETKKKQWCYNCEQDAIYHCCWNTAYCSPTCQQQHWQAEHKKVCRRKR